MQTFGVVARIKAPEGYRGVWINIYASQYPTYGFIQAGGAYVTRKRADLIAKPYRHDCVYVHVKEA